MCDIKLDNTNLYVESKPIVINRNAIIVSRGGKIMGTAGAEYDLSNLPAKYHADVLSIICMSTEILV